MSSVQEAEGSIDIVNEHLADYGKHVVQTTKRLLFDIFRFTSGKTFNRASAADEPPFILFKNYPDRIVIECNHDDFTVADIQAICQPCGEDQVKAASFRSVLIAAKKVHIQSGNVSLEFESHTCTTYTDVLKPAWVMPTETLPNSLSRITLYIYDHGSEEKLRNVVASQFEKLKDPCILFLRDFISMSVESYDKDGKVYRSKTFLKSYVDAYRISVKTATIDGGLEKSHTQLYHVTTQSPADQPTNVMLAFPLSDKFEIRADTGACGLFNFVQLRGSPLRFHIHSDFDFDGKRGPIPASSRNLAIKDSITSVFFQAALQFCEHPTLRYHWPSFLLSKEECLNPFWVSLEDDMRNWIAHNPVLISRSNKHWRHISHLTILSPDSQDKADNPLLDDKFNDPFLSNHYPPEAIKRLENYGLTRLDSDRFFELLGVDFNNPWVWKHRMSRNDWTNAFDRLPSKTFIDKEQVEKIKSLPLLQLKNGDFVSAASGPLYFQMTGDVYIPESLGLRMVHDITVHRQDVKALYQRLGVLQATVSYVRNSIFDKFSTSKDLSLGEIKSYLLYLYLTHQFHCHELKQPHRAAKVMTTKMEVVEPRSTIIYLPGMEHRYSPEMMFSPNFLLGHGPVNFLHKDILQMEPKQPYIFHPSWKDWLRDYLGVRQRLSLLQPRALTKQHFRWGTSPMLDAAEVLSEEFQYVLEKRPEELLGFIQHHWASDGPRVLKSPILLSEIQGLPVRRFCTGNHSPKLQETWVPLKTLQESVKHYMENANEFPFLDLGDEDAVDAAIYTKWDFLVKDLGVKRQKDMVFLLEILNSIKLSCHEPSSCQTEKVFELYTAINTRLQLSIPDEKEQALNFFENSGVLYIDEARPIWTGLSSCRWNAPANLITKYSLETLLRERDSEQEQMDSLSELFRVRMSVTDVSVKDLVEELLVLGDEGCKDVARVSEIYKYLDESLSATDEIRTAFEECAVILVEKDGRSMWVTAPQCFWSEADTTTLNSSLKTCYPNLKSFFIDKLGIKVSAYDRLLDSTTDDKETWEVRDQMLSLMEALIDQTKGSLNEFPPAPMRKAKIFEVDSQQSIGDEPYIPSKLCSVDTDFAIGDRPEVRRMLGCKIKMLAYDLKTVRRLQPLFRWLSIEDRYLSRCAKEKLEDIYTFPSRRYKPRDKVYQITRVGETFNCYGSSHDAFSLYEKLQKAVVVEADFLWARWEVFQDGQKFQSQWKHSPSSWISEKDNGLTIYVMPDRQDSTSALAKRFQEWLIKDTCQGYSVDGSQVFNALASIFSASGSTLDRVLWEQGIVEVPFENNESKRKKAMIKVRLPEVDEREPRTVAK